MFRSSFRTSKPVNNSGNALHLANPSLLARPTLSDSRPSSIRPFSDSRMQDVEKPINTPTMWTNETNTAERPWGNGENQPHEANEDEDYVAYKEEHQTAKLIVDLMFDPVDVPSPTSTFAATNTYSRTRVPEPNLPWNAFE